MKKYSMGEILAYGVVAPATLVFIYLLAAPFFLVDAWMQATIYNWFFPPYLGLPVISIWLMVAVGLFLSLLRQPQPVLKDEYLKLTALKASGILFLHHVVCLLFAWGIHRWILKG